MFAGTANATGSDIYGPVNLLKTMPTPFGMQQASGPAANALAPLSLNARLATNLASRLVGPRLFLPGRMVIGSTETFVIKGHPGSWVALAMADKNSGAKPIYGHKVHLGADRKLVSLGQIPEGGVLELVIDTPIQGDLIGAQWYFEAAVWSKPDFSDVEMATPVASESAEVTNEYANGVVVAGEPPKQKKGVRIVPDGMQPMSAKSLDIGRP